MNGVIMHENFEKAQQVFVSYGARISEVLGLSEGMAEIAALMYISPEPLSIPDICEKLNLTKGTVSVYLRLLEERKIIVRSWTKKKGRQKFFEINPSLWQDVVEDMRRRMKHRTELTDNAVDETLEIIMEDRKNYDEKDFLIAGILTERLRKIKHINRLTSNFFHHFHPEDEDSGNTGKGFRRIKIDD